MHLESITAENFLSYAKIERKFADATGLTLIEGSNLDEGGSNGAGKSAVWDAISWALFGETVRGLKSDAVVHRKIGKDCFVTVVFGAGTDRFEVTRYRAHSEFANRLVIRWWEAGKDVVVVEQGSVDATEKWLLNRIGIDFELLRCTMLFAQGETFNFVDATDKKQKEILSKIKRLDLQRPLEVARKRLATVAAESVEIERKIGVLESHRLENPSEAFAAEIKDWVVVHKQRIRAHEQNVAQVKADLVALESKLDDLDFDAARKGLLKLRDTWEVKRKTIREASRPHLDALAIARGDRRKAASVTSPVCGECGGPIDIGAARARVKKLDESIADLTELTTRCEKAECKIDGELAVINEKLASLRHRESQQKERIESIRRAKLSIGVAEEHLAGAHGEKNPWLAKRAEAMAKQEQIEKKLVELAALKVKLSEEEVYLRFWEVGFSDKGLKSFVFDTICASLTRRANHYLGILTDGSVSIAFDTQTKLKGGGLRERFECSVMSDGETVPYAAYSGGEKTRISLAVDMSLADLMTDHYGSRFNVVVFDEQDVYLDRQGRQFYLQLLKERAKTQHVFVVAHDAEFKGMFDESWTIEKKGGFSRFIH